MNKTIIICLYSAIWIFGQNLYAQPKIRGKVEIEISMEGKICMGAKWSPNGQFIAFTSERHNGLWKYDINNQKINSISNDLGAGFGYSWSADSRHILARPLIAENGLSYYMVKTYEADTGKETIIVDRSRIITGLPAWSPDDLNIAVILGKEIRKFTSGKPGLKGFENRQTEPVDLSGNLIFAGIQEKKQISFDKFKDRHIFNISLSPLRDKVVFQVNGLGLFVSNINGENLKHLGFGEQASWMPDNKFIVVTRVKDNGHSITEGALFSIDTDTGQYYPLFADPLIIALKPCVSPDGSKLLFDNLNNGAVYCVKLSNQ
jgi:Tol biopolymer transport system component